MTFKKNGTDPGFAMPPPAAMLPGLPGGPSWIITLGHAAQEFVQSLIEPDRPATFYDGWRDVRSGRGKGRQAKPRRRPNMLLVSKRVRRKHRRAKR